jgi:hypothetical protein
MIRGEDMDMIIRLVKHQWFDPGTELLLGQVGAKALLAKIPERIHYGVGGGSNLHEFQVANLTPLYPGYPQTRQAAVTIIFAAGKPSQA